MDLRQLECFLAVCQELYFSRAAEKLHMSQPTLSRHIRNLEQSVGMPLFDRMGRGVALTEAGHILLAHAQRVFHELEQAEAAIRDLNGLERGRLTVGVLFTASYLLPTAVSKFKQMYPNIELAVFGLRAGDITDKLLDNELDVGVSTLPVDEDELEGIPLFTEELALAVSSDHKLAKFKEIPLRSLKDTDMILPPKGYCLRKFIDECCADIGLTLQPTLEMSSLDVLIRMVADGAGATVLPKQYIEALGDDAAGNPGISVVNIVEPVLQRDIGFVYRKGKFMCATTRTFIAQLHDIVDERVDTSAYFPRRLRNIGTRFDQKEAL